MLLSLVSLATFIASATAHATFQQLWINDVDAGNSCVRLPASNSPVTSVSSPDLACNANAASSNGVCSVQPGDSVTVEMHQQNGDRSCANEAIGGQHYGPMIMYLAKVSDARTAVGSSASWFKINEMGLVSNNPDYFGNQVLNDNCGHYTFKIPTGIAPGNYLLRAETIALHTASSSGGAQFYMSCYQINIGGSGTANPPTVKIPGAYSASDPGILVDIHRDLTTYVVPGPAPYGTTAPAVANTPYPKTATWNTANQPKTVPTVVPGQTGAPTGAPASTQTSGPAPTNNPPATGSVAAYGQCGGQGWTGGTACVSGYTCNKLNDYYSQCIPS
ncbi:hypothetical protein HGRIS_006365 [Hohenbuehelia grisea]|uniref:AA9 family lytic polysaccharide monooxygenase n=1 Tax=Hohenbuehelia grisea TaxID=104357 RepID=A0ABR3K0R1_9AGAR